MGSGYSIMGRDKLQGLLLLIFILMFFYLVIGQLEARENSTALYNKGAKIANSGNIDEAIVFFKRVIEISPYYSVGHYGLGKAYLYKEDMLADAISHLKKAVFLDRKLTKGHFYLGIALMFDKSYMHALHSFKNAYRYDNSYIEALYNIAVIYDIMESRRKAREFFDRYIYLRERGEMDILF